jgi:hypothetical protein
MLGNKVIALFWNLLSSTGRKGPLVMLFFHEVAICNNTLLFCPEEVQAWR